MGMSGKDYDKFAGDFTPNKDRKIAEWRKKKDAATKKAAADKASEESKAEVEKEEKRELDKPVTATPSTSEDSTLLNAITNGTPGAPEVRQRRRKQHFSAGTNHPTLF